MSTHPHRVIITGTGRAGTTFLVMLLTELGLNTGFAPGCYPIRKECNAGLEKHIYSQDVYLVKQPAFCTQIPQLLTSYALDHVLVPVRDMDDAARSRMAQGRRPGGLWHVSEPSEQKEVLLRTFGVLVSDLVLHEVPHTFLIFPRLAKDPDYCFATLQPVIGSGRKDGMPSVPFETFREAFERVSDPCLIHEWKTAEDCILSSEENPSRVEED